ncbi:MAG: nucleotidyltransferase domain-containing protein [Polyangiales bacterium]
MSPEIELILRCLRARFATDAAPAQLDRSIDFDRLLALCERHGVVALVADQAPDLGLTRAMAARAARSLLLAHELRAIVDELARTGIEAIAYKGPALALEAYGDVALRSFSDLDLVVRPADFERARSVLVERGYRTSPPEVLRAPRWLVERSECDETLVHGPHFVELHWAVTPPGLAFPLSTDGLFERARERLLSGRPVLVPSIEDQLVLLAMNGTKDAWSRLEVLCAFTALARKGVDWRAASALARELRAERMLRIAFELSERLLGATPPRALTLGRDRVGSMLARHAMARSLDEIPSPSRRSYFVACSRERVRDTASMLLARLFTPTWRDATFVRLPQSLSAGYYLVRPLRLAFENVAGRGAP